jgi:hypothetical protein
MRKFITKLLLIITVVVTLSTSTFAQSTTTTSNIKNISPTVETPTAKTIIKIDGRIIKPEIAPFVTNGQLYVPATIAKNFGATVEANSVGALMIRKDIRFIMNGDPKDPYTAINWQRIANKTQAIKGTKVVFVPLKYVAETLNCDVKFDSATNTYNITNKGLIKVELTKERYQDVKGYVKDMHGNPVANVKLYFIPITADGLIGGDSFNRKFNTKSPIPITTDANGFYEFKNIDTDVMNFATINTNNNQMLPNPWFGENQLEVDPDLLNNVPEGKGFPGLRVNTKRLVIPTIYVVPNDGTH